LLGDKGVADHGGGGIAHFIERLGEADTAFAFGGIFEFASAAATGMDLGFDDINRAGEFFRGLDSFFGGPGYMALKDRNAVGFEQFLALILMYVHGLAYLFIKGVCRGVLDFGFSLAALLLQSFAPGKAGWCKAQWRDLQVKWVNRVGF
jgi:hypothetical protein